MTLKEFLWKRTNAEELCVIREDGWIVASCWIDYEDLFFIPQRLSNMVVKNDEWDYLPVVNENNARIKIPCHYVDV
jgi:hypothetical protein